MYVGDIMERVDDKYDEILGNLELEGSAKTIITYKARNDKRRIREFLEHVFDEFEDHVELLS